MAARNAREISVVLTNFGLLKEGSQLQTQYGTPTYYAPEILSIHASKAEVASLASSSGSKSNPSLKKTSRVRRGSSPNKLYIKAVDIWSLGIIVLEIAFGLPHYNGTRIAREWFNTIMDDAKNHTS